MSITDLYPPSPVNVPESLTKATSSYRRQAMWAMLGLALFIYLYLALTGVFGYITYATFMALSEPNGFEIGRLVVFFCSALLTVFLLKSLFAIRKMGTPSGLEVFEEDQPELYAYLHQLADEIGAPKPHRVFLTPEVNAAVFYDLSILNLIFPSKKNLIVGLGLVNVLNLSEFKAVLAHEFGHFSQRTMMVGRWVYVAQQIIAHMVSVRDWLDNIVQFISRIDVRIAWIGWILQLVLWSLRSLMEVLFRIVIIAERALSREMEFNADLVAVSVTGSDELVNALYKLQAADQAWRTAMNVAGQAAGNKKLIVDLFEAQTQALEELRRVYDDPTFGNPPEPSQNPDQHRIFEEQSARPPQMWSTHPASSDREANAKMHYVPAVRDSRSAWLIFRNPEDIRKSLSRSIYNVDNTQEFEPVGSEEFVSKRFSNISYSPEFRGAYLGRSPVRDFQSVDQMMEMATIADKTIDLGKLYPETIKTDIKTLNQFDQEIASLEALLSGEFKPSGGVIRHRGEDIRKADIPEAIEEVRSDKKAALQKLMVHEANCRKTASLIAQSFGQGWSDYLDYTIRLLHAADHMLATVSNEKALLINTWNVITADGSIGYFEKRRLMKVCRTADQVMTEVSAHMQEIKLTPEIRSRIGIESWKDATPVFDFVPIDGKNFVQWVQTAVEVMNSFQHALNVLHMEALEDLLEKEKMLRHLYQTGGKPDPAPAIGQVPKSYPVLLEGDEYVLQKKLDIWNRFQLAHGFFPSFFRTVVSLGIVGGTIYAGLIAL